MVDNHIGNLQCNVSHIPPNAYSVTSHTGSVELLTLLAQRNFMSRKMFLKMLLNVFSFLCGVIDRKFV